MVQHHSLVYNKRAEKDEEYSNFLLAIGDGNYPTCPAVPENAVSLLTTLVAPAEWTFENLIYWVFGDVVTMGKYCAKNPEDLSDTELRCLSHRAVLAPENDAVQACNEAVLSTFHASEVIVKSGR